MQRAQKMRSFTEALPFWLSIGLIPTVLLAASQGGYWLLLPPLVTWWLSTLLDAFTGLNPQNKDPQTKDAELWWYNAITLVWFPIQAALIFGLIYYVTRADHLTGWEQIGVFFGVGVISGAIGITYSHELMHQRSRQERLLADLLLASVFYGHFRSEHLRVHHRYIGTPRDPVSARYNEGFHRFFPRVLWQCLISAWDAEAELLSRQKRSWWDRKNPFWRYGLLQLAFLALAFAFGGWVGIGLFFVQAAVAVWQLELTNYVEHYGLTRRHLGDGRYEHTRAHHSWNSSHQVTNWLLINLQRHSDHHAKPDRRFPLLQTFGPDEAPQLPFGYPLMGLMAMIPPVWKRVMNHRVKEWRKTHYPDVKDWHTYNKGLNPLPR